MKKNNKSALTANASMGNGNTVKKSSGLHGEIAGGNKNDDGRDA